MDLPQLLGMADMSEEVVGPQVPLAQMANQNVPVQLGNAGGMSWQDALSQIGLGVTQMATPFARPHEQQSLRQGMAIQQAAIEKKRLAKSAQETGAITQLFSSALTSEDPKAIINTLKSLSGLKDLQPETYQSLQKLQLQMSEKAGQFTRNQAALQSIPEGVGGPEVEVYKMLLGKGVDDDTAKLVAGAVRAAQPKAPEAFTLNNMRYLPQPGGGFAVVEGPPEQPKPVSVGTDREALAQEQGFPNFAAAPQEAKVSINKEVKRREDQRIELQRQNIVIQGGLATRRDGAALRDDFIKQSKPFVDLRDSYNRINVAPATPAGDMALVFGFMKMLDPTSVVREGEYATAKNAAGVPDRVKNSYNQLISGKFLTTGQRADFKGRAEEIFKSQASSQKSLENEFRRIAKETGLDPSSVIVDFGGSSKKDSTVTIGNGKTIVIPGSLSR